MRPRQAKSDRPLTKGTLGHQRIGHISKDTIARHILDVSTEIHITDLDDRGLSNRTGEAAHRFDVHDLSKSKAIISRRDMSRGIRPFEVVHVDLIDINPTA